MRTVLELRRFVRNERSFIKTYRALPLCVYPLPVPVLLSNATQRQSDISFDVRVQMQHTHHSSRATTSKLLAN